MHLTRSDLFPERISPLLAKAGGYCKVSWLKNSSIFPPRICVDIYICENSRTCILSSCDSVLADRPFVFDTLNVGSLFFLIGSSSLMLLRKIIVSLNSACCFLPISSIFLTVNMTLSVITSFVPSWTSSFNSSGPKGFHSWLSSVVSNATCFANFSWKAMESSWWWNLECSFPFSMVMSSNSETTLATSELQIYHLQNLPSSFVKPTMAPLPDKGR